MRAFPWGEEGDAGTPVLQGTPSKEERNSRSVRGPLIQALILLITCSKDCVGEESGPGRAAGTFIPESGRKRSVEDLQ